MTIYVISGLISCCIAFVYNLNNEIIIYEDKYNLYFADEIYLIKNELKGSLIRDALNLSDKNFHSYDQNNQTITIQSREEIINKEGIIIDHVDIIFKDFLVINNLETSIKEIKKISTENKSIKNKLNLIFFLLLGASLSFTISYVRNINKKININY